MSFQSLFALKTRRSKAIISGCLIAILVPIALIGTLNFDFFTSAQSAGNVSFSTPVNLSDDTYQAQYPWVSVSGSIVYVAWTEEAHGIYFRVSSNDGSTWTPEMPTLATRLSPTGGTTSYPVMAENGSNVYVAWTQTLSSGGNSEIFVATSNNNGQSFNTTSPTEEVSINLTEYTSDIPYLAAYGNDVYLIWHAINTATAAQSVWVSSSSDAGQKWTTAIELDLKSGQADEPQIAAWGTYAFATWDRNGPYFSYTSNNGLTWSTPVNLNPGTKSVPAGTTREPWITAAGCNIYVTWNDNSGYGTTLGDVYDPYIMVSNNCGQTWNQNYAVKNVKLNLMPNSSSSWEIQDQAIGNTVYVIWRDHTPSYGVNGSLFYMMSTNAGQTWTPAVDSQAPVDISNGDPGVTGWSNGIGASGNTVAIAYMGVCSTGEQEPSPNSGPGDCNMMAAYSNNGGQSFYPEVNVSTDGTSGPITDVSSSNFAVSGPNVFTVWQDENMTTSTFQVFFSSTNGQIVQTASFSATPVRGAVGTTETVTGNNFETSSTVTVEFDSSPVATLTSNSSGGFSTTFTIPPAVVGSNTITASDGKNIQSSNFNVVPNISLSPVRGATGTSITVSGTGYASNSAITVTFGSSGQVATATTNSVGSFAATFNTPNVPAGANVVTATDGSGNSNTANYNVVPNTSISPVKGPTGTSVAVTGTGFAASSVVDITFGTIGQVASTTTNSSGSFSASFTVANLPAGTYAVTATDASANSATSNYNLASKVSLSPVKGATGKTVTVTGSGFDASTTITISFGATLVTTTPASVESNASGSFSATFTVPDSPAGSTTVTVTDGVNTATTNYNVVPNLSISPKDIASGKTATVTVTGTGYAADSQITITFGGNVVTTSPSTVVTDSSGDFTATFAVPKTTPAGTYAVQAMDASGNSDSSPPNFTVKS